MAAKTASLSVNIIADAAKAKAGLKEAETAFGRFKSSVGDANGVMGKFQAGASSAFSAVKANAMNFAAAGGAAIVAFGVKSVSAFQDLTLTVKKFSDATGLSYEEASRLIEVAGDIGIEVGALEKSLGFMNKTLGNNAQAFKDLGVEIAYTSGGAVDANQTFLNVVERLNQIEDPAQRAAAGAKLLGRGWQEMAELIAMGSDELTKSLNSVSKQKIRTPEQVAQAEQFRKDVDELKDRFEDLTLTVGGSLVPVLSDAAKAATVLFDALKLIPGDEVQGGLKNYTEVLGRMRDTSDDATIFTGSLELVLRKFWPTTEKAADVTDNLVVAWQEGYRAMIDASGAADGLTTYMEDQASAVAKAQTAWDSFKTSLEFQNEFYELQKSTSEFEAGWAEAVANGVANSQEWQTALRNNQLSLLNFAGEILKTASVADRTRIRIKIETGEITNAIGLMNELLSAFGSFAMENDVLYANVGFGGAAVGGTYIDGVYIPPNFDMSGFMTPGMATGGTVLSSGMVMVGEEGPELLSLPTGASVTPNIPARLNDFDMGGGSIVVNVQAGLVSTPDQVGQQIIDAIRRAERRSGQVFASV